MRHFAFAAAALLLQASLFASNYSVLPGSGGEAKGCIFTNQGRPAIGVEVTFYTRPPGLKTGSHYHDTGVGRPNLVLNHSYAYTGPDGCAVVDVLVPFFAGTYGILVVGSGMTDSINIIASVSGMAQLYVTAGMAPLSTYYDPGHGNEWMGKSPVNLKINGIAGSWHLSNYDALYGGMTLTRYSLPEGGDLDNNTVYWAPNPDGHPSGVAFDMVNPSTFNYIPRNAMKSAINSWCGPNRIAPLTGSTVDNSSRWHVSCY